MKSQKNNFIFNKGFTLIELLVVISIVGLLSSIVLASLTSTRERARITAGMQFAGNMYRAYGADAVGYYRFNEGSGTAVNDSSGLGHNTTVQGSPTWSSDVPATGFGTSMVFNGSTDRLIGTNTSNDVDYLGLNQTGFMIMAWIKPTSLSVAGHDVIYMVAGKTTPYLGVYSNGALRVAYRGPGNNGATLMSAAGLITTGKWYHVAAMQKGGNIILYIDGKEVARANNAGGNVDYTTNNFFIGDYTDTPATNFRFAGHIDDVAFINFAQNVSQ